MKFTEAKQGRIFVIRMEYGDVIPRDIEAFAKDMGIQSATVQLLGGADIQSQIISGPIDSDAVFPEIPLHLISLDKVHESLGIGTIMPDEEGEPVLHLHLACGNLKDVVVGCSRQGVKVWIYMEVILVEMLDCKAKRVIDSGTGFTLLDI